MHHAHLFENTSVIFCCALVFDLHPAPAFKRGEQHEQALHAGPLIFVIVADRLSWLNLVGVLVSPISCFEVSSRQTKGRLSS